MMTKTKLIWVLGALLFLSLSINFFVAGLVIGGKTSGRSNSMGEVTSSNQGSAYMEAEKYLKENLSEDDKKILRNTMKGIRGDLKEKKADLENAREAMKEAMHAKPFDEQALEQAQKNEREKKVEMLRLMSDVRKEAAAKMSPEGRKALSQMGQDRQQRMQRFGERGGNNRFRERMQKRRDARERQ